MDIRTQADRLINRAEESYNFGRIDRVGDIAQRYRDNILRTGSRGTFSSVATGGRGTNINPSQKFSARTYMGLSKG